MEKRKFEFIHQLVLFMRVPPFREIMPIEILYEYGVGCVLVNSLL